MPTEVIGEVGTPGTTREQISAQATRAIWHIIKNCGPPPPEMELEVQSQEHELGGYPIIVLTWEDAMRGAPWEYIAKCEDALVTYERRSLVYDLLDTSWHHMINLFRSRRALSAEVLFLRKQLAFYQERQVHPRRLNDSARFSLLLWSRLGNWKNALVIVKPETLIGWHRKGFKLFWRWKSQAARPRLPEGIRQLIAQMAQGNPTWGQARVAAELSVKLGIYVSPRTVRAYWPPEPERRGHPRTSSQNWRTFIRNHAQSIVACDFLVVVTARFRTLQVFLLMEVGTRRIVSCNLTAHPTAAWTLQQLREAIPSDHSYRFLIRDRDALFSAEVDRQLKAFGLRVLHIPARAPKANAYCERLVETTRRDCLDFMIPLVEKHLRRILAEWVTHYERCRTHLSLEKDAPVSRPVEPPSLGPVIEIPKVGGLHHLYTRKAA